MTDCLLTFHVMSTCKVAVLVREWIVLYTDGRRYATGKSAIRRVVNVATGTHEEGRPSTFDRQVWSPRIAGGQDGPCGTTRDKPVN